MGGPTASGTSPRLLKLYIQVLHQALSLTQPSFVSAVVSGKVYSAL